MRADRSGVKRRRQRKEIGNEFPISCSSRLRIAALPSAAMHAQWSDVIRRAGIKPE